jgi:zinc transport system substrate-binding protein
MRNKVDYRLAWICWMLLELFSMETRAVENAQPSPLTVVVSNYPLAYFAERLGGGNVSVSFPVPADADPAFWQPDPKTIATLQKADLIALNGADYEKWIGRVTLPRGKSVDTSANFKARFIVIEDAVTHSHGPGGRHSHTGMASTTWLDFEQAMQQAGTLAQAIIRKRMALKSVVETNLAGLVADLRALDGDMHRVSTQLGGQPLLASHPVYQYLARGYGLNLEAVHWEPEEMPPPEEWKSLREILKKHPARLMLWEEAPSAEIRRQLTSLHIQPVAYRTCANRPASGDFMSVMRENVQSVMQAAQNPSRAKPPFQKRR